MATKIENEEKEDVRGKIIERRDNATKSLNNLLTPHTELSTRSEFISHILVTYGVGNIDGLGLQEKYDLAMKHLTRDLLWQTFFDSNGKPTKYGLAYLRLYPDLDLNNYEYAGVESIVFLNKISEQVTSDGESFSNSDVVDRYIKRFSINKNEEPPILLIPGLLTIGENSINFREADSFIPPFGGNSPTVTIYTHLWD